MNPEQSEPMGLEALRRRERTWVYPLTGVVFGVAVGILVGHPLAMLAYNLHECWISGTTCNVTGALTHSFRWHMWPMMLIFGAFGGVVWGFIGLILQRLRESHLRLEALHRKLLQQTRYLNTYLTISSMVAQCLDLPELLEAVLPTVMETVSAEEASILLLDGDGVNLEFYSLAGPSREMLQTTTFPADKGIAGSVLQNQQSEVINDVRQDPRFYDQIDSQSGVVTRNMMAIPLTAGEEKIGLMEVLNKSGGEPFTDDERLLLESIAEEVAFAIRNAKIFEYVVNSYCKQRQGATSCKGCQRPLKSWTPCAKYLAKNI